MTVAQIVIPSKAAAAETDWSAWSWSGGTALCPGAQIAVTRMALNPAALARSILARATAGSALRPSSSAAPICIRIDARALAGAMTARKQRTRRRRRRVFKGLSVCPVFVMVYLVRQALECVIRRLLRAARREQSDCHPWLMF